MNKKTILAAVLSMAIIVGALVLKQKLYPAPEVPVNKTTQVSESDNNSTDKPEETKEPSVTVSGDMKLIPIGEKAPEKEVTFNTETYDIIFSTKGGVVKSLKLKDHQEKDGSPVEMINTFDSDQYSAFNLSLGENESNFINETFLYKESSDGNTITFYRDFYAKGAEKAPFRLEKIYQFSKTEYAFELTVNFERIPYTPIVDESADADKPADNGEEKEMAEAVETDDGMLPFDREEPVYSLNFGPQIGPAFAQLSKKKSMGRGRNREFRNFVYLTGGKRKALNLKKKETRKEITDDVFWAGINGKYFSVIVKPNPSSQKIIFSADPLEGIADTSQLFFTSNSKPTDKLSDSYVIYCGPNQRKILSNYNKSENNTLGLSEQNFDKISGGRSPLFPLEWLIQKLLDLLFRLIPNYGIAIILVTIIIKAALFPVTHKSFESTSKMQSIQPKVNALREKFKDDPQKLNAATMDLYKQEGVNPMGGCLPMLLQMPFLIAMFGVLDKHFALRNAVFIPGWITNLAGPETIFNFSFTIPLLQTSEFHLLPFIYLGVQLLTTKITQATSANATSNAQMKIMTYGMPIFFFFIMYSMPSGLLMYWTVANIITVSQQLISNKIRNKS